MCIQLSLWHVRQSMQVSKVLLLACNTGHACADSCACGTPHGMLCPAIYSVYYCVCESVCMSMSACVCEYECLCVRECVFACVSYTIKPDADG